MLQKILVFVLLLVTASSSFSEQGKEVVVNRLSRVTISVDTPSPVLSKPVFFVPQGVKLLDSLLKTSYGEKYHNELELIFYCDKAGSYDIGPFVFLDKEGNSHPVPPLKIVATQKEEVELPASKTMTQDSSLKFYTVKPQETVYAGGYIFFVLEIPANYQHCEIIWHGWEQIYTEKQPEIKAKNGNYEIKYALFFEKEGKYNLAPLKIKVNNGGNEQLFSSAALHFEVKAAPEELDVIGSVEGTFKPSIYTATHKNYVQIDILFTGSGNLYSLKTPEIEVLPQTEILLRKRDIEIFEHYPEIKGKVNFSYIFFPEQDGSYQIRIKGARTFVHKSASFKNISGYEATVNVMMPSNPHPNEYQETLRSKLNIKARPDYDFYAIIVGLLLITFLSIGLYIRNIKMTRKTKKRQLTLKKQDHFSTVLKAVLSYLRFFTGEDLTTLPLSGIVDKINKSSMDPLLMVEIIRWLEESFKQRYLLKGRTGKEELLAKEGIELLRKMKKERQRMVR